MALQAPPSSAFRAAPATANASCRRQSFQVRASSAAASAASSAGGGGSGDGKVMMRKEPATGAWKIDYSCEKPATPLLDTINYPIHMKNLSTPELEQLSAELRAEIVHTVSKTGGHLSASLGVVELAVVLHRVFDTPEDKIIWDVGHQSYPHKILTGRRSRMHTMRKTSGLAGFPKRDESAHDAFGAGHSSTSISAALGMAVARDLLGNKNHVVSVIGDGAMTAGQAYEAMNNSGYLDANMIVVLNDNKQVSLPTATLDGPSTPVGALSKALTKLQSSTKLRRLREAAKNISKQIGATTHEVAAKVDEYARGMISASGSSLFEDLGLYYIGPVDGHSLDDLVTIFEKVKAMPAPGPVLVHIVTEKGKGYPPAEAAADKMHGVVRFDPATGRQFKAKSSTLSYTQYFAESLIREAEEDDKVVAIHAAMGGGTGLNYFHKRFPERCFDVGIAEQHAVTFAAGLAAEGMKPFCAIYSSFLQRGYDQVVHDVDLQRLPVRFAMDRAGLVGADGPTHCGAFDVTYMACLPNMVVMAPADEAELMHMVATAAAIDDRPSCFRFPRGNGIGALLPPGNKGTAIQVGKGRVLVGGNRVALLGYGTMVQACLKAAEALKEHDIFVTVADARFCKPLDTELIRDLAAEHEILITAEEGSIGGFGSHVAHYLSLSGLLDGPLKLRSMFLPDRYIDHGAPQDQMEEAGLTPRHIAATVLSLLARGSQQDTPPTLVDAPWSLSGQGLLGVRVHGSGSLADRLQRINGTPPLPCFHRFRIAWEIASALVFLHSTKPSPIIHRFLKPENVLLDGNLVSKIGDVGLATLVPLKDFLSGRTMYKNTGLADTLFYIDPKYQRTGQVSVKSDTFALGMVILQLLTVRPPIGLPELVERALEDGQLRDVLDESAGEWPVIEAQDLAQLGLSCMEMRSKNRPDLKSMVAVELERLKHIASGASEPVQVVPAGAGLPSHFICPILKRVMQDPCIAADRHSYKRNAIEAWLCENDVSPLTKSRLPNKTLVPNRCLSECDHKLEV